MVGSILLTGELLRELFKREMKRLCRLQAAAAAKAVTFEELVRSVTHQYLKYFDERGLIIDRLQAEPSVSEMHDPTESITTPDRNFCS